jgi:putative methyltransferase (TIGR04325 family)
MNLHNAVKQVLPPFLFDTLRSLHYQLFPSRGLCLRGNYSSWSEAVHASTGYDSDVILQKTKDALVKVKIGEAVYERDSVLFDEIQYSWPLLAGLMWAAARSGGRLNVLDFGGSLGSTYFQNHAFLKQLPDVRWSVIEQAEYIRVGKEFFEDDILRFYPTIDDYSAENTPDVVVLSSVLQYLENPYEILSRLLELRSDCIILDRTPFWEGGEDHICVQHVPASIYPASYPIWIFSKNRFLQFIQRNKLNIVAEFEALDKLPGPIELAYRGMIITRTDVR